MNEIATGSSRVIRRDKNTLITLNVPLEITQKRPLAKRNFEFSGRQVSARKRQTLVSSERLVSLEKQSFKDCQR
jgi:hypothetical protein